MKRRSLSFATAVVLAGLLLPGLSGRGDACPETAFPDVSAPGFELVTLRKDDLLRARLSLYARGFERYAQRTVRKHFVLGMSFAMLDMNRVLERY